MYMYMHSRVLFVMFMVYWNTLPLSWKYRKKERNVTCYAVLFSAFVFATYKVQSLYFLNPKFQASSHLLGFVSHQIVNRNDRFSRDAAPTVLCEDFDRLTSILSVSSNGIKGANEYANRTLIIPCSRNST